MPVDKRAASRRQDASIVVPAMARYIAFAGAIPGMPELAAEPAGERLVSGRRLLEAAALSGWRNPVDCLLDVGPSGDPGAGAVPFSVQRAEARGSDARLLTFGRPLSAHDELALLTLFTQAPQSVGEDSWAWDPERAPDTGKWTDWVERVLRYARERELPLIAINGRRPPQPPASRMSSPVLEE
jgi:hypothetical protein